MQALLVLMAVALALGHQSPLRLGAELSEQSAEEEDHRAVHLCGYRMMRFAFKMCEGREIINSGVNVATICCRQQCSYRALKKVLCPGTPFD